MSTDTDTAAAEARARIAFENPVSTPALTFAELRAANVSRMERWHANMDDWIGSDRSNAMCGEAGEVANVVKKLRRHETNGGDGYNTPDVDQLHAALADELADVVAYVDLLAHYYGVDLARAVAAKFNRISAAQGFPERIGGLA